MTSLWCYPWTLAQEGITDACDRFDEIDVDAINLSSHYHSVRSMQPRFPDRLFVQQAGGCHFAPETSRFDGNPIHPVRVEVEPFDDPLAEIVATAGKHGIDVNGWMVLFHNSRLGAANPDYRLECAFGQPQDHALCPSHPEVREYFATVVAAIADRGVAEIQLESLGYQTVFHGHGANFGHDKRQVLTTRTEEILLSQCFCDGCRNAADTSSVDMDAAQRTVRKLLKLSFANPQLDLPPIGSLVAERPVLQGLFDFRTRTIERLAEQLATTSPIPLNYYVMDGGGVEAGDLWPAGVRLTKIQEHLDRVTALCYVRDPAIARQHIREIQTLVDCPIDVGITLDRETIRDETELIDLVNAARNEIDGRLHFYHHSLVTDAQLEWIKSAI